jgi:hypothetical protein
MMKTIYDNRTAIGKAKTAKQAEKIIRKLLQHIPNGWKITVFERNTAIINLPAGWVYSVHP